MVLYLRCEFLNLGFYLFYLIELPKTLFHVFKFKSKRLNLCRECEILQYASVMELKQFSLYNHGISKTEAEEYALL